MEESRYKTATKVSIALFEGWQKFGYDPNYYNTMIKTISDVIYKCPKVHSGYVSTNASGMSVKDVCPEHYYSRTQSAKKMVELMQKGLLSETRLDRFEQFMRSRARVHYVTSEENMTLRPFQSNPDLSHWKQQYEAAGIRLEKWSRNKYVYEIDGNSYSSSIEAAKAVGCHESTVVKRCVSTDEKWSGWSRRSTSG